MTTPPPPESDLAAALGRIGRGARAAVWLAAALWTLAWTALFAECYGRGDYAAPQQAAAAGAACVYILAGFVVAHALCAAFARRA